MVCASAWFAVSRRRGPWRALLAAVAASVALGAAASAATWTLYDDFSDKGLDSAIWQLNDGMDNARVLYTPKAVEVTSLKVNGSSTTGSLMDTMLTLKATGEPFAYRVYGYAVGGAEIAHAEGALAAPVGGLYTIAGVDLAPIPLVGGKRTVRVKASNEVCAGTAKASVALAKPKVTAAKVNGNNTSGTYTRNTLTFKATNALQYRVQAAAVAGGPLLDIVAAAVLPAPGATGVYTISPLDITGVVELKGKRTIQLSVLNEAGSSAAVKIAVTMLAPKIASLIPSGGQFVGDQVTIKGSGFGPGSPKAAAVTFNGVMAPIVSWNETAIVCTVPEGATSGMVSVTSAEMPTPAGKVYAVYPSPVGAWDLTWKMSANQKGTMRCFLVKEAGRYFYLEDAEGVGSFAPAAGGKLSGKVYWFDQYEQEWNPGLGVSVSRSEVEETDTWSLAFGKAEAGKPATFTGTVTGFFGKATVTAQRDQGVDPSTWTWPLHQVFVDCMANVPHFDESEEVSGLVLVRKPAGRSGEKDAVLMSLGPGRDLLLSQPEGLPANLPFSVWYGCFEGQALDLTAGAEVVFSGSGVNLAVDIPPVVDRPLVTGVTPLPGSAIQPGVTALGFEYQGTLPAGAIANLWVQDAALDRDVYDGPVAQTGAGVLGGVVPTGVLKSGKVYGFGVDILAADTTLNQAAIEYEFNSATMVSAKVPDTRYAIYYSKSASDGASILWGWWDLQRAKWVLLASNVSGARTVTVPAGATALKIQTNGRTLIDAAVRHDARDMWFESYWEDYWDKIAFDEGWDDLRNANGACWYLLGSKTYIATRFTDWVGGQNRPLQQAVDITITPGQD